MIDIVDLILTGDCCIMPNTLSAIAELGEQASASGIDRPDIAAIRKAARTHRCPLDATAAAFGFLRCSVTGEYVDVLSDFGPEVRPAVHDGEEWWCFVMALSIAGDRYDVLGKVGMPVGLHLRQKRGAIQAMRNDLDRARAVNDYGKVARLAERLEREQVALAAVEGGTLL